MYIVHILLRIYLSFTSATFEANKRFAIFYAFHTSIIQMARARKKIWAKNDEKSISSRYVTHVDRLRKGPLKTKKKKKKTLYFWQEFLATLKHVWLCEAAPFVFLILHFRVFGLLHLGDSIEDHNRAHQQFLRCMDLLLAVIILSEMSYHFETKTDKISSHLHASVSTCNLEFLRCTLVCKAFELLKSLSLLAWRDGVQMVLNVHAPTDSSEKLINDSLLTQRAKTTCISLPTTRECLRCCFWSSAYIDVSRCQTNQLKRRVHRRRHVVLIRFKRLTNSKAQ